MKGSEIAADLNKAADLIENGKWCQGTLARAYFGIHVSVHSRWARRFCLVGAIQRVEADWQRREKVRNYVRAYLGASLGYWNDQPGRTKREVVAALRSAAIATAEAYQ